MSWEWLERLSWIAGIVSALVAVGTAWAAYRAAKGTTRDLALLIAAATDNPELLEKLEAAARQRAETVRRRLRTVVAAAGNSAVFVFLAGGLGVLFAVIPDYADTEAVGGSAPRTWQECAAVDEATVCTPVHDYELFRSQQAETLFGGVHRPSKQGTGRLSVELPDCKAEVRWHVSVGGAVVAEAVSRDDLVKVEFPIASDQAYTFVAERPADDGCPKTTVRVRTGITFDR
ncbi:hypothetical protein [Amycolatopsis alba]|uniref:Uncharacterized protein n=1 Tax=Amycolatopsis alba DSM 44262 TaxID=1125972 RepID=A0A229S2A0_AMYAL|nr:hypothetical protein [Amycolatopsis alba]OXM52744.1 hypothetical protein CFP75_09085 [Amycolatopsis alba DSM 44262]